MTIEKIKDLKSSQQAKTIGELLKTKREQQIISIREISAKTKISQKIIVYLENDNLSKLPNRAYVIGFLKTLSETLGIDYTEALELYDKAITETLTLAKNHPVEFYLEDKYSSNKTIKRVLILIVLCITIIVLIIFNILGKKPIGENSSAVPAKSKIIISPANKITALDTEKNKSMVVEPKIINLSIKAIDGPCWIAYQIDDKPIVKYTMQKGKGILLTGQMIKLQVGNYKVINIEKDNVPVKIMKTTRSTTSHLIFPESLIDKIKPPFFIFHSNGVVEERKLYEGNEITIKDI